MNTLEHEHPRQPSDSSHSDEISDIQIMLIRWMSALTPWERLAALEEIHASGLSSFEDLIATPDLTFEINPS